ncbi:RluA family pseudouridine synthase [Calothrix sp. 336/3]|uniref:RluA family pseudouridine synthase n=1 Tax=Calothrix sp. 336/3 TaxID=1337936 RepID=UPI0004E429A7|nr:RluA family pseudouridine synthase [Calothrix sp. 336/3]AKG23784.1 pseudouridine synthase [Calothrix sp. 336/3]
MTLLQPLTDFISIDFIPNDPSPTYYYEGKCPQTGEILRLPRTPLVEAIAHGLMELLGSNNFYSREGKMYGVLLVQLANGEQRVLKAFSGLLDGVGKGWVPAIPGREKVAFAEAKTLAELEYIKQKLIALEQLPQRVEYKILLNEFEEGWQRMRSRHQQSQQERQVKRQILSTLSSEEILGQEIEKLDEESRKEGIERRNFKRERNATLQPFIEIVAEADEEIRKLKRQRQELSRKLQSQMHAVYTLTNFAGKSLSLEELGLGGLPTGTGDCCAPKLLHYAATHQLKPVAIAEFWWGSTGDDKVPGKFYGACSDRCQPIMGFLLSGMKSDMMQPDVGYVAGDKQELTIIYQDEWLIAVNKPPGLLSVPGRYFDTQDCVVSRLHQEFSEDTQFTAVHRLDRETSGILLIAKDLHTYRHLSQQFQQRQIHKIYEAVIGGVVNTDCGVINLPLWGNPEQRPYQEVNFVYGKESLTKFQVMGREGEYTRIEFIPFTGRTHQLRVHAADSRGIGKAILGDRLYGCEKAAPRLHLHAREISFYHPGLQENMTLRVEADF